MVSEGQPASKHENAEVPADEIGQGVGALLHATRLRCNEDVEKVARMLCIRSIYLVAIEEGRFSDLPGPTYVLGFVRAYADFLGLDSAEVVRRYKQEILSTTNPPALIFPTPTSESGAPGGAILLVGVAVALVAYGAWYVGTSGNRVFSEVVSPLPARLAALFLNGKPPPLEAPASAKLASESEGVSAASVQVAAEEFAPPTAESAEAPFTGQNADRAATTMPSAFVTAPAGPNLAATATLSTGQKADKTAPAMPSAAVTAPVGPSLSSTAAPETSDDGQSTRASPGNDAAIRNGGSQQGETAPVGAEGAALPPAPSNTPAETPIQTPIEGLPSAAPPAQPAAGGQPVAGDQTVERGTSRIVVRAKTDSWIQVRDSVANRLLLTRLLRAGDSYDAPDRAGLQLLTGNAGALEILVDGVTVPAIGPVGAVRRGVALDAGRLREGTAGGE